MPFEMDFSDLNDQGYRTPEPGQYPVKTTKWQMRQNHKGNFIVEVDLEITAGEYAGESQRYFHVITQDAATTKTFLFRLMRALGVVRDGDRGEDGGLKFQFEFADGAEKAYQYMQEGERVEISGAKVNGNVRVLTEVPATAVIVKNDQTKSGISVDRLEPAKDKATQSNTPPIDTAPQTPTQAPASEYQGQEQGKPNGFPNVW